MKTDVVVIGAGPGGYVAALRLAQLGKQVTLVEKYKVGGTCLQVGCIPSKALIGIAKEFEHIRDGAKVGIKVDGQVSIDLAQTQDWKRATLEQLTKGIQGLCKANKVNLLTGTAKFTSANQVVVQGPNGHESVDFDHAIIATGSVPIQIPGFTFDGKNVISSTEALDFTSVPKRMAVIGGGYIGLEIGSFLAKLGTAVTVLEMTPTLMPGFDTDLVEVVARKLRKNKVEVFVDTKALGYQQKGGSLQIDLDRKGEKISLETDIILVTVGRKPLADGLDLEKAGVERTDKGFIQVNASLQTSTAHIYAIGDVAGQPMLAHKASKEADVAAEHIAGHGSVFDAKAVPAVVFTDPELSSVGLNETEAKSAGYDVFTGKFPFSALGKTVVMRQTEGFVKIVAEKKSRAILGVQIAGAEAGTMISEAVVLLEMGATVDDLAMMIHPHPTAPEAFMEAVLAADGRALHMVNRN